MSKAIQRIPAKKEQMQAANAAPPIIRLAAYCRVSTDEEEQLNSFANQVQYYREYCQQHSGYVLVDIYADEEPPYPAQKTSAILMNCRGM